MKKSKKLVSIAIVLALAFTAIIPGNWLGADGLSRVSASVFEHGVFDYKNLSDLDITPEKVANEARKAALDAAINVATDSDAWTVAVYLCGTDLETKYGASTNDLNEMLDASIKMPENVNLIVFTGGAHQWHVKDKNYPEWRGLDGLAPDGETTRIFQIKNNQAVQLYQYEKYLDLADTDTLQHFLEFVEEYAPAGHTMVTLWDHGGGPLAGCEVAMDKDGNMTRYITVPGLKDALNGAMAYAKDTNRTNHRDSDYKYDIFSFDCCLMGNVEIAYELEPFANYMIGSEETEPGSGWNYQWLEVFGEAGFANDPVKIGKKVITLYSNENTEDAAITKWRGNDSGFRDSTLALYDLSKMEEVKNRVNALGIALSNVYGLENKSYYYKITRAICELKSFDDGERGLVDSYLLAKTICEQVDALDGSHEVSALTNLKETATALIDITGSSAEPIPLESGKIPGQIGGANEPYGDGLTGDTDNDAILFRAVACDYAGGNGISIFYPAHSTVLDENKEGVKDGNVYGKTAGDNVLSFSQDVPNYVSYLNMILHPSKEEMAKSVFNGTLESAIVESESKTIAYIYSSQDMEKLVDAKVYITTIGASKEGNNAILYGSLPAKYDESLAGGSYYVDADQNRLGFNNDSTKGEFEFFTYEKSELSSGEEAYEIPVYYFDKETGEKGKEKGTEISEEEVSHLGLVKKSDGTFVVEYFKTSPAGGVSKKIPMTQYAGSLSFNPLYLRQDRIDETTGSQIIYTAQTDQTINPTGGAYIFEAQEIPADDDILVYSFKAYDIFGNVYESEHDPVMFTFNPDKMSVDSITDKSYTGKEITLTDNDIKFRYGDLFEGENALTVSALDEIGVGYEIASYSDNVDVGTATVKIRIFDKVSGDPKHSRVLPDAAFKIVPSGDTPAEGKDISTCTVSGIAEKIYNGKAQTQNVTIKDGTTALKVGTDYTVSYKDNTDAGTAKMTITGKGNYKGTITKTFVIKKAANTMTVKVKKITAKANKKTTFKKSKVFKIKTAKGKVTFKKTKVKKKTKDDKKITISKTGKVTVGKGLKKGKTYTVKVTVTAAGSKNYTSKSKVVKLKVKVK